MDKKCILPWVGIHGNLEGNFKLCCFSDWKGANSIVLGNSSQSITEVWNDKPIQDIRRQFLEGKIPEECKKTCYDREKISGSSPRLNVNREWPLEFNGVIVESPKYFDIRFGNLCNFRCRSCGPIASTRWAAELKFPIITDPWSNNPILWDDLPNIMPNVEEIYFAGGEPFIQEGHYRLLNWLIDNKLTNKTLVYNTNLSILKHRDYDLKTLWQNFDRILIWPSADGAGAQGEYTRKGFNWEQFKTNCIEIKEYVDKISCVVSILSIYSIPEMLLWLKENGLEFHGTCLISPTWLSLQILSKKEKKKINTFYKGFLEKNAYLFKTWEVENILAWLRFMNGKDTSNLAQEFKRNILMIDGIRGENFINVYPEYKTWFQEIPTLSKRTI